MQKLEKGSAVGYALKITELFGDRAGKTEVLLLLEQPLSSLHHRQ